MTVFVKVGNVSLKCNKSIGKVNLLQLKKKKILQMLLATACCLQENYFTNTFIIRLTDKLHKAVFE